MEIKARLTGHKTYCPDSESPSMFAFTLETPYTYDVGDFITDFYDKDVRVELKVWREKRSLNANKYFHLLSDRLADSMRMSKPKMKNYLLFHYGQKVRDDDGNLVVIKTNANEEELIARTDIHLWYLKDAPDGTPMFVLLEHSRFYDSRQMSILIDGVVNECKAQGIETLPPSEIQAMKERWGVEL